MDHLLNDYYACPVRKEQEEDPPPPHVVKAMSKIAIYAATYGSASMYLRDPVVAVPIGVVQEWLAQFGYQFQKEEHL